MWTLDFVFDLKFYSYVKGSSGEVLRSPYYPDVYMASEVQAFLWPGSAEQDPGFRREIERLSRRTLWVLGAIELTMTVVVVGAKTIGLNYPHGGKLQLWSVLACVFQGVMLLWLSRTSWGARWGRALAFSSGFFTALLLTWFQILAAPDMATLHRRGSIDMITILLVGVALIPAIPWQMAVFGASVMAGHIGLIKYALATGWLPGSDVLAGADYTTFVVLTLLCTALAATNYQRIFASWSAHQAALKSSEESHAAETRAILAESVASMGRLAAAISHEMNTPLGSAKGSVSGLLAASAKLRTAPEDQRERIAGLMDQFGRSALEGMKRLELIIRRMQRFTNLDRAEVQDVNLNEILEDVAAMVKGELDREVRIHLELNPVPLVRCQPQPLNSVLSGLLHRAVERTPPGESITLSTISRAERVEVHVREPRSMTQFETVHLFDPAFRVKSGRIAASNWTMFHARRILTELGGDIAVDTSLSGAVVYRVSLPSGRVTGLTAIA